MHFDIKDERLYSKTGDYMQNWSLRAKLLCVLGNIENII